MLKPCEHAVVCLKPNDSFYFCQLFLGWKSDYELFIYEHHPAKYDFTTDLIFSNNPKIEKTRLFSVEGTRVIVNAVK